MIDEKQQKVIASSFEVNQTVATKKLKTRWKGRIIWTVRTKSELKEHSITLNQSLRLERE